MSSDTQIAARFDDDKVSRIDELIDAGRFDSRAEALRVAMADYLDAERRRAEGRAIADGYRRIPQTAEELQGAEASARAMIREEPW